MKKIIPYFGLGNHQVLAISGFCMNCYFKELSQINILGTVLQQFCKKRKISETIVHFEEISIIALDKYSRLIIVLIIAPATAKVLLKRIIINLIKYYVTVM